MEKFYVVVRSDLPHGTQATQAAHAAIAFCLEHAKLTALRQWNATSNNLVLLSVPNERELDILHTRVAELRVAVTEFSEPDLDDQSTAIAFAGTTETMRLVSSLPLALRERRDQDAA